MSTFQFIDWLKKYLFVNEIWIKDNKIITISIHESFLEIHKGIIKNKKCYLIHEKRNEHIDFFRNDLHTKGYVINE